VTGRTDRSKAARALVAGALAAVIAVIALFAGALPGLPASAVAQPVRRCTATSGALVVVDFAHWGGPLLRACGSTPSTGYALLNQGGWVTTGTEHDGPGFICRIGYAGYHDGTQYPTPDQQPCADTPPANAYWAFWQAGPGQDSWNYSQVGAMSYRPAPGSVELWSFGGTSLGGTGGSARPAVSPDRLRDLAAAPAGSSAGTPIVNAPPVLRPGTAGPGGSARPAVIALAIGLLLATAAIVTSRRRARLRR
jgi:hypothetical protein